MNERIFLGLNDQQSAAVAAVRGPVCILAGAGSGKTTTITRRIANQIATGTFVADEILAVTFTEKAAREMGDRLGRLGVAAVRARTFHAEALAQYKRFSTDTAEIMSSKGQILAPLVARLPMPHKFTAVRDIATEIEWAKNRCVGPDAYAAEVERAERKPPVPVEFMTGLYSAYERRKAKSGHMDFEDLLARCAAMLERDPHARSVIRSRYRAMTVDEYQDVNLLQQSLLDLWVGERDDICVVGDDYQSIFGFTGATPRYLLTFPDRYVNATVVQLTHNYRSTPQVLAVANRLVPRLGGRPKSLRAVAADGPEPIFRQHATGRLERDWIVAQCRALRNKGVGWEEMAVLYRVNGRSEDLEEAFSADRIPYQVRDGAFLRRPAARGVLAKLRRSEGDVADEVARIASSLGWHAPPPAASEGADLDGGPRGAVADDDDLDPAEATRLADLGRLVALAQEFSASTSAAATTSDGGAAPSGAAVLVSNPRQIRAPINTRTSSDAFVADLERRFAADREGRGVQILTYHRAKGLEFEAVFLPRMEEKELPFALSRSDEDITEERRLLYVGITRAKRYLSISWAADRQGERRRSPKPSAFLDEIRPSPVVGVLSGSLAGVATKKAGAPGASAEAPGKRNGRAEGEASVKRQRPTVADDSLALFTALKDWRLQAARHHAVPAYVVFHDETLARIAEHRPRSVIDLGRISGIGPAKIAKYGSEVLELVGAHAV